MFNNMTIRGMITAVVSALFGLVLIIFLANSWVHLDASQVMVIQAPISGELTVITEPGTYWQGFGTVTKYPRRDQYSFSAANDEGTVPDQSIKTGFNDGGSGNISGVVSWEIPLKPDQVIRLHKEYGSLRAIDQQLIRPMLEKIIFSTGAMMSSIESSSERRSEIPQTIDDQLQNGPYLTRVAVTIVKDPMTHQDKSVKVTQIATDKDGKALRASASTIKDYGITLSPVTVNRIFYEESVQKQIDERQKSTQAVQLSQAAAIKATQDAITTEQQGQANAAMAKWEQKTINAKEIALAEKDKTVAKLKAEAALEYKRQQILEGEGDAAKRKLIMAADGQMALKIDAFIKVQGFWADAFARHTGQMVPSVMMGNGAGSNGITSTQQAMEILNVTNLKALGLDMANKNK